MRYAHLFIGALMAFGSAAQAQDTTNIVLAEVTIYENRFTTAFSKDLRNTWVIRKRDLQETPGQSVPDMLQYVAGVNIQQRGPAGVQADISLRSGTFDQTLVLLNGVKLNDPQTGHHVLNLPLNLDNIEQIEVLKGPAARIYGQNAFSGAVNIVTKVPNQKYIAFSGYAGDFGLNGQTLALALPGKKYSQYFSVSQDGANGYRYNTDFGIINGFYQSKIQTAKGNINIIGGYTDRRFGANGFYGAQFKDQWEAVQTSIASVDYDAQINQNLSIKPRLYWRRNQDEYLLVRNNPALYRNLHKTNVLGAEIHGKYRSKYGVTGFGIETRSEQINSNNLGNRDRQISGIFLEHRLSLGKFSATPGVFVNYNSDFGWKTFPGIDLGYAVNNRIKLFATAANAFRVPTYTDLFYVGPTNVGNPDLKPEEAVNYEAGLKYFGAWFYFQGSYYQTYARRVIDWVRASNLDPWQPQNLNNVDTKGLELSAHLYLNELNKRAVVRNIFVQFNYLDANLKVENNYLSRYSLQYLKYQISGGIEHTIVRGLTHQLRTRYVDRATLPAYWVVDSRFNYAYKNVNVFAEATNLLNEQYTESSLVPMPGRWFRAGLQIKIDLE